MATLDTPAAFAGSPAIGLICRECSHRVPLTPVHVCEQCFAPLEVEYDHERRKLVTRQSIEAGPPTNWR